METGFRVCLKIDFKEEQQKSYYIFVDRTIFKTVRDLEEHIKKTFELSQEVTLLIDDCILPRNENISVVLHQDCIRVQLSESKNSKSIKKKSKEKIEEFSLSNKGVSCGEAKHKKNDGKEAAPSHALGVYPKFLWNMILPKSEEVQENNSVQLENEHTTPLPTPQSPCEIQIESSDQSSILSIKRKRKRKHKSAKQSTIESGVIEAITPPVSSVNLTPTFVKMENKSKGRHSYFSSENEEEIANQKIVQIEDETTTSNKNAIDMGSDKDADENRRDSAWGERLLQMAEKSQEEKTFYRNKSNNTDSSEGHESDNKIVNLSGKLLTNFDPLKYPIVNKLKENDVIAFKILKIGEDYCPTQSGNIFASVIEIDQHLQVSLKILKGQEEFETPDGKFSMDNDSGLGNSDTVHLNLNEMMETRLLYP